eukprot:jgi/Mesvir1/20472/Mv12362-RA.2
MTMPTPPPSFHPTQPRSYLHTNTTSHTWVLGAFAELLDNAKDSCAGAATPGAPQRADVNYDAIGDHMVISVVDTGSGMDSDRVHLMLSFGHCNKDASQIGQYGNGAKSGALRISRDVLVVTWDGSQVTCALLSQTMHTELGIPIVRIPLASWRVDKVARVKLELAEGEGGPMGVVADAAPMGAIVPVGVGVPADTSAVGDVVPVGVGVATDGDGISGVIVDAAASVGTNAPTGIGGMGSDHSIPVNGNTDRHDDHHNGNGSDKNKSNIDTDRGSTDKNRSHKSGRRVIAAGMAGRVREEILARVTLDEGYLREELLVPVCDDYQENLNFILQYSPFDQEEHLKDFILDNLVRGSWKESGSGTAVLMYDVSRPCSSNLRAFPELDFATDPEDIRLLGGVSLSQTHSQREPPLPLDHSLRRYCELLYLRNDMDIYIRGIVVDQMNLVAENAAAKYLHADHRPFKFRPAGPGSEVTAEVTLGLNAKRGDGGDDGEEGGGPDEGSTPEYTLSDVEYGTLLYNRGRLIRAYERIGLHASKVPLGVGIVAVVDESHLSVVHNKQAYLGDAPYKTLIDRVRIAIENYVVDVDRTQLLAYGTTKLQQEAARKAEELYQRTQQLRRMEEATGHGNLVQCVDCFKWRFYPASVEFAEDEDFVCSMNTWDRFNNCDEPMECPEEDPEAASQFRRWFVSQKGWPEVRRKIEAWRGGAGLAHNHHDDDDNEEGRQGNPRGGARSIQSREANQDSEDGGRVREEWVEFRLGEVASADGKHRFGLPYGYWRDAVAAAVSSLGKGDPVWVAAAATLPRPPSAMSSTTGPWGALVALADRWEAAHPRTGAGQLSEEIKRAIRASAWIEDARDTRHGRATGRTGHGASGRTGGAPGGSRRPRSASPGGRVGSRSSRHKSKKRRTGSISGGGRRQLSSDSSEEEEDDDESPLSRRGVSARKQSSKGGKGTKGTPKKVPAKITLAAIAARRATAELKRQTEELQRQRQAIAADARRRAERERRARELDEKRGRAGAGSTSATPAASHNGDVSQGIPQRSASLQSSPGPRGALPRGGRAGGTADGGDDMDDDGFSAPPPRAPRRNPSGGGRADADAVLTGKGREEERLCICRRLASECENDAMYGCVECGLALHAECIAFRISELDRRGEVRCEDHEEPGISARRRQRTLELATPTCSEAGAMDPGGGRGGMGAARWRGNGYNCYDGRGDEEGGGSGDEAHQRVLPGGRAAEVTHRERNKPPSWPKGLQGVGYTPCNRYGAGGEAEDLRRRLTLVRPLEGVEIRELSEDHPVYIAKLRTEAKPRVFGVFASKRFERQGMWVGDYVGVVTTGRSRANEYVFEIHADQTGAGEEFGPVQVDALRWGNELRFMNDYRGVFVRGRPNVKFEVKHDEVTGELRVRVVTLREVRKGDEFLVDYGDMFPLQPQD